MQYFKINYNKLENLPQINYYKFISIVISIIIILIVIASQKSAYHTFSTYGIYKDNVLHIKINSKLSDAVKNNEYISFKDINTECIKILYDEYEIVDNEIYQDISITLDKKFIDNEIGLVKFYYHKQNLLVYIFELFK